MGFISLMQEAQEEVLCEECLGHLIGKLLLILSGCLPHLLRHLDLPLGLGVLGVGVVVSVNHDHHPRLGMDDELPRREVQREGDLVEHGAELLQGEDAESTGGDGHDPLRALLGGEARGEFESVVGERREVEPVAVVVGDPGPAGHGQHRLSSLHRHPEVLHRPGPDVSGPGVAEVPW